MSAPAPVVPKSDEQRWLEWQERGVRGDRRRAVAVTWVMALIAIGFGVVFGSLL